MAVIISGRLFEKLLQVRSLMYTMSAEDPGPWESGALGNLNEVINGAVSVSPQEMDGLRTLTEKLER